MSKAMGKKLKKQFKKKNTKTEVRTFPGKSQTTVKEGPKKPATKTTKFVKNSKNKSSIKQEPQQLPLIKHPAGIDHKWFSYQVLILIASFSGHQNRSVYTNLMFRSMDPPKHLRSFLQKK